MEHTLHLRLETREGIQELPLEIARLVVAGWVGKDKARLQEHIQELGKLGVPAPSRTPTYMNLSPVILTTGDTIDVVGPMASAKWNASCFAQGIGFMWGSDRTIRTVILKSTAFRRRNKCAENPWRGPCGHLTKCGITWTGSSSAPG